MSRLLEFFKVVKAIRNPNRLYEFYRELQEIHITKYPDLRFGQMISNLFLWITNEKKVDPFFVEDENMEEYIKEFAGIK